ncbi:uncharacterized protein LOC127349516 [Dicentrarchus labrax]|uniref:C-C motif chemokine n=1 Tax=Dicentrarchus labrax TaxID=13489 RepID=A0A8C4I6Q0_DICLA|nr:uncharacterized protein LOC127349516 [Dicentrarchus labrax]
MQRTVQVIVVLLNIVWIVFFLQTDPSSVSVQRRSSDSSDEEMLFGEFCIQPESDMNWTSTLHPANDTTNKTNNTNTTTEECAPRNFTLHKSSNLTDVIKGHSQETSTQAKDLHISQLSLVDLRTPAPGSKPRVKFETHPAGSPAVARRPSSSSSSNAISSDDCCFKFYPRRINRNLIFEYYLTDMRCPTTGVILVTKKHRHICADPGLPWVQSILDHVDRSSY